MNKPAEIELAHLKTAVFYLSGLLEEGSLVPQYDTATRQEIALALQALLEKVSGLPTEVPENLVRASAVRALIVAGEKMKQSGEAGLASDLGHRMREAEVAASLHGHTLNSWQKVSSSDMEYVATCPTCDGVVYVSHNNTYSLLTEQCEPLDLSGGTIY